MMSHTFLFSFLRELTCLSCSCSLVLTCASLSSSLSQSNSFRASSCASSPFVVLFLHLLWNISTTNSSPFATSLVVMYSDPLDSTFARDAQSVFMTQAGDLFFECSCSFPSFCASILDCALSLLGMFVITVFFFMLPSATAIYPLFCSHVIFICFPLKNIFSAFFS